MSSAKKEDPHWAVEALKKHPKASLLPIGVVAGAATGGILMGPILGAIGFSSIGPVAGSIAAGMQSAGTAGAIFSTVQSAPMGGYGVAAVTAFFTGAGAAGGAVAGLVANTSRDSTADS